VSFGPTVITPLVDVERLLIRFLRDHQDVETLCDQRVYTKIPAKVTESNYPLITLHRFGGIPPIPYHLDAARIHLDAWGKKGNPGKVTAHDLAAQAHAALHEAPTVAHDLGVVTGVTDVVGLSWLPDPDTGRDRYFFECNVFVHPEEVGS